MVVLVDDLADGGLLPGGSAHLERLPVDGHHKRSTDLEKGGVELVCAPWGGSMTHERKTMHLHAHAEANMKVLMRGDRLDGGAE